VAILAVVRGGGAQVTTDLLSEWTDPDTAMEAVGNSLGVFDNLPSAPRALKGDTRLRGALYEVLLRLVDGGALETRATADGRYAFRWRAEVDAPEIATNGRVLAVAPPTPTPPVVAAPVPAPAVRIPDAAAKPPPPAAPEQLEPLWHRLAVQTAPLLLPTLSCVIVLLAFVWLDQSVALVIAGLMAIVGVVGVIRRVQLAAFWTIGLVIAGLLLRFS
jgi:hypothetical protein